MLSGQTVTDGQIVQMADRHESPTGNWIKELTLVIRCFKIDIPDIGFYVFLGIHWDVDTDIN